MTFPTKAFILAAGYGKRMRPLTDTCPKPLLKVGGVPMIDRVLDALAGVGVDSCVVNLHHLGEQLETHLKAWKRPQISFSHEETLLDTGGGVRRMLPFFDNEPFFVLNGDVIWEDGAAPALERLARAWNEKEMDALLMLQPLEKVGDKSLTGDYHLDGDIGRLTFHERGPAGANTVFAGPRIVHPRLFDHSPDGAFSFLKLFHRAEVHGRLFGIKHDGDWHHVGTPEALAETDKLLKARSAAA